MNVLVGCETSGIVREAFRAEGHEAMSCDILPADDGSPHHYQGDLLQFLADSDRHWDLAIFHPPCTFLSSSGLHWNTRPTAKGRARAAETAAALEFVRRLLGQTQIPRIALENPVGCISTKIRKASQYIHPWQHGEKEAKTTGLWLKGLPLIQPTAIEIADWCCECGVRFPYELGKRGCPDCEGARPTRQRWANQTYSGQNVHGPSVDRWKIRSKSYTGIARALARQWGQSDRLLTLL